MILTEQMFFVKFRLFYHFAITDITLCLFNFGAHSGDMFTSDKLTTFSI